MVEKLIAQQKVQGIAAERIVLAGFSQGCAMTLQTGLRHPERLAGLLCLSGYLPIHGTVPTERNSANHDTPIFMAHGRGDPIVPISHAEKSRDFLQSLGYQVEWHEYLMEHSVCEEEIDDIGAWLRRILA
jgi:phospholipase/carboxylesterase